MVAQVSTRQVVHDKVEVLSVLEGVIHVDDERVLELLQNLPLVHDRLDAALGDYPGLAHLLHGKVLLDFLELDAPHLSEAALPNAKVVHEVRLRNSYRKKKR